MWCAVKSCVLQQTFGKFVTFPPHPSPVCALVPPSPQGEGLDALRAKPLFDTLEGPLLCSGPFLPGFPYIAQSISPNPSIFYCICLANMVN